ncbi:MAG: CPBP family intramembrane metalloprotease [Gemmatimonadetes bacterium]|nr:CPBP family intramembrane metalloprotease [Gemmatimonadota bacterium]
MNESEAPEHAAVAAGVAEESGPGPFAHLRTRTLLPVAVVVGAALYLLLLVAGELGLADLDAPLAMQVAQLLVAYSAIALWIWIACRRAGVVPPRLLGGRPPSPASWLAAAGLLAAGLVFSMGSWYLSASVLSYLAPGLLEWLTRSLAAAEIPPGASPLHQTLWHLEIVLLAPVVEELLFRGVLVNRWGAKWGIRTGVLASSAIFACLHANPVGVFALGLVAALLYLRTGTLLVPIALHVGNNLIATVMSEFADLEGTLEVEQIQGSVPEGLLLVGVGAPALIWYVRRSWPRRDAPIPYVSG